MGGLCYYWSWQVGHLYLEPEREHTSQGMAMVVIFEKAGYLLADWRWRLTLWGGDGLEGS